MRSSSRRLDPSGAATANPAVARCGKAYAAACEAAIQSGESPFAADASAEYAHRNAMPPLAGAPNIRNFIARVAHGALTRAILAAGGTRFLDAARVAYSTVENRPPQTPPRSLPQTALKRHKQTCNLHKINTIHHQTGTPRVPVLFTLSSLVARFR